MLQYQLNCTQAKGEDVLSMQENAKEIQYETFLRNVGARNLRPVTKDLSYEWDARNGLTLKGDPFVRYFKSRYQGAPCYYFCYSRMEYIFF